MMLCNTCEVKEKTNNNSNSIWDLKDLKYANKLTDDQLLEYHFSEPRTWAHWNAWYIGAYQKWALREKPRIIREFFELSGALSKDRFYKLISKGIDTDSKHTALHHLYLNANNINDEGIKKIAELLIKNGLNMDQPNEKGITPRMYIEQKKVPFEKKCKIDKLIKNYKEIENQFNHIIKQNFDKYFDKCEKCGYELNYVEGLERIPPKEFQKVMKEYLVKLKIVIDLRNEVANIYKTMGSIYQESIERHEYLVNIYKKLLVND